MTAFRISDFQGMAPRIGKRLLNGAASVQLRNAKASSGELRATSACNTVTASPVGTQSFAKIYGPDGASTWMFWPEPAVQVVQNVLSNDPHDRVYWCIPGEKPRYNSYARIVADEPSYLLGMPNPPSIVSVVPGSGGGTAVDRAYLTTYLTSFGEESFPSEPVVDSGDDGSTWTLNLPPIPAGHLTDRDVVSVRIYRSLSGLGTATFRWLADVPVATATYDDDLDDADLVDQPLISQDVLDNQEPPEFDLMVKLHNGIVAAANGSDIYFSTPFKPFSWPIANQRSITTQAVGFGSATNSLIVLTRGNVVVFTGDNPGQMQDITLQPPMPCISAQSVSPTRDGVVFATTDGLAVATPYGVERVLTEIIGRDWWHDLVSSALVSGSFGPEYFVWADPLVGIKFDLGDAKQAITEVALRGPVLAVHTDEVESEMYVVYSGFVFQWSPYSGTPLTMKYKSKEVQTQQPVNFGALEVYAGLSAPVDQEQVDALHAYNAARLAAGPLDTLGMYPLSGPVGGLAPDDTVNRAPLGGPTLYDPQIGVEDPKVLSVSIYADGIKTYTCAVTKDGQVFSMPAGFMATVWSVEVEGTAVVKSIALAETRYELRTV